MVSFAGGRASEEFSMRLIWSGVAVVALLAAGGAAAHHGWGSYDASKTIVLDGPILESAYEFPHGEAVIELNGVRWTATLAPPSRMQSRGLQREDLEVGKRIKAEGYPSTVRQNEMRAERVTVGSRVIEMR
jgi:Family of unknown function (DUF6152)